jgi:hypothetical protein
MGILLTFMFLLNMLGALTLIPALAHFFVKVEKPMPVKEPMTVKESMTVKECPPLQAAADDNLLG